MDYSYLLEKHKFDKGKLLDYGFEDNNGIYEYTKDLDELFSVKISIKERKIDVIVFDKTFNEEYILFTVKKASGDFLGKIKKQVNDILDDIVNKCFENENIKDFVLNYVKIKYNTIPIFPWKDSTISQTLNCENGKWYGLITKIPYETLVIDTNINNHYIDIINLKVETNKITKLVNNENIFNAYHMNKKNWITIILDNRIDKVLLTQLIDKSYFLVNDSKKKNIHTWIIPININFFDIMKEYEKSDELLYKQSSDVHVNDIVYIYLTAPLSKIFYKCKVLEVDIPYDYKDENIHMKRVMKLLRIKTYDKTEISIALMRRFGVVPVRGPRNMPYVLEEEIKRLYDEK